MKRQLTRAEFKEVWEQARMDVQLLLDQDNRLVRALETLYEGVLGEDAPEMDRKVRNAS